MRFTRALAALAAAALLAGCAAQQNGVPCRDRPNPTQCRNQRKNQMLLGGAMIGGAGGAIIGALAGNAAEGAAIGAGAGALGGALAPEGSPTPQSGASYYRGGASTYGRTGGYGYQYGRRLPRSPDLSACAPGTYWRDALHPCPLR